MPNEKTRPTLELGVSGLTTYGGRVAEEWLRRLQDERGLRTYREMSDNDATVGAALYAIEMILRNVGWRVEPFSPDPVHVEQAEFVGTLTDDMSHTWEDTVSEILTMLTFGFTPLEIVYKRREGPQQKDPRKRSLHSDGLIGWRKLAIRAQETIDRWEFDEDGGIVGMYQIPPNGGEEIFIPIKKLLLFRTTSRKNNPQGRSALRNCFVAWYRKKYIEENEAIGIARDLAGMPVFYLPPEYFDPSAPAGVQANLAEYRKIIENIKQDEQAGLLLPAIFDEANNRLVDFQLTGTGSRRLFDTSAIIQRYDQRIAQTLLADVILLGHEKVGSFALSSDKTSLLSTSLGAYLKEIAAVMNRHAIPRVYELNGWDPSETATMQPNDIEKPELLEFANAVAALTGAGWLMPGGEEDEAKVRDLFDLPEASERPAAPPPAAGPEPEEIEE